MSLSWAYHRGRNVYTGPDDLVVTQQKGGVNHDKWLVLRWDGSEYHRFGSQYQRGLDFFDTPGEAIASVKKGA